MKIETKRAKVDVVVTMTEDEAIAIAQLAFLVSGDSPTSKLCAEVGAGLSHALEAAGVKEPTVAAAFAIHKSRLYALPMPDVIVAGAKGKGDRDDPNDPPEPVAGKTPKFV